MESLSFKDLLFHEKITTQKNPKNTCCRILSKIICIALHYNKFNNYKDLWYVTSKLTIKTLLRFVLVVKNTSQELETTSLKPSWSRFLTVTTLKSHNKNIITSHSYDRSLVSHLKCKDFAFTQIPTLRKSPNRSYYCSKYRF